MKKIIIISLGLVVGLVAMKKSLKKSDSESILRLSKKTMITSMDPSKELNYDNCLEIYKVYEGLYEYDKNKNLIPNLAESLPEISEDGLVYTIKIRKKVYYHENKCFGNKKTREVFAKDFIYSIMRVADPRNISPMYNLIQNKILGLEKWIDKQKKLSKTDYNIEIEGLKIIDDYTFKIILNKPFAPFLNILTLCLCAAIPREAVEFYGDDFRINPAGTGPFCIDTVDLKSNKLIFFKNKNYGKRFSDKRRDLPYLDKIEIQVVPEDQVALMLFKQHKLDLLENLSQDYVKQIANIKNMKIYVNESLAIFCYVFNNCVEPFKSNKYLRQAISLAYDREDLNKLFFNNTKKITYSLVPESIFRKNAEKARFINEHDRLERIKELLKKAGYPNGEGLREFTLDFISLPGFLEKAEFFKRCMEKIGIKIKIQANTYQEFIKKIENGTIEIFSMGWIAAYPDPENLFRQYYNLDNLGNKYLGKYNNEEYNKLYEKAEKTLSETDRKEIYNQMNDFLTEEVPNVFIYNEVRMDIAHENIHDFNFSDEIKCVYHKYIKKLNKN